MAKDEDARTRDPLEEEETTTTTIIIIDIQRPVIIIIIMEGFFSRLHLHFVQSNDKRGRSKKQWATKKKVVQPDANLQNSKNLSKFCKKCYDRKSYFSLPIMAMYNCRLILDGLFSLHVWRLLRSTMSKILFGVTPSSPPRPVPTSRPHT